MHPLLDLSRRPVVGHRGNSAHAPENTLESFRQAVASGVDALEMDVHASADGAVVVIHDPTLDRTTDGSGRVEVLDLATVRGADAGARFTRDGELWPWRDRGIRVPTIDEVLEAFPDTPLLIESKAPGASAPLRAAIERHGAVHRCVVGAFVSDLLEPFRGSGIAVTSTRRDALRFLLPVLARLPVRAPSYRTMCLPRVHRGIPVPLEAFARAMLPHGIPVHVWTVDDPATARALWAKGVRGIISNDPAAILAERRRLYDSAV